MTSHGKPMLWIRKPSRTAKESKTMTENQVPTKRITGNHIPTKKFYGQTMATPPRTAKESKTMTENQVPTKKISGQTINNPLQVLKLIQKQYESLSEDNRREFLQHNELIESGVLVAILDSNYVSVPEISPFYLASKLARDDEYSATTDPRTNQLSCIYTFQKSLLKFEKVEIDSNIIECECECECECDGDMMEDELASWERDVAILKQEYHLIEEYRYHFPCNSLSQPKMEDKIRKFGCKVRAQRNQEGATLEEYGRLIDKSSSTIRAIEQGRRSPTVEEFRIFHAHWAKLSGDPIEDRTRFDFEDVPATDHDGHKNDNAEQGEYVSKPKPKSRRIIISDYTEDL